MPSKGHEQLKHALWDAFTQELGSHKDEIQRHSELVTYALNMAKMQADRQDQLLQSEERKESRLFRSTVRKYMDSSSIEYQDLKLQKKERASSQYSAFHFDLCWLTACRGQVSATA